MNLTIFNRALDEILAHPLQHDQTIWHYSPKCPLPSYFEEETDFALIADCGTAHCLAGWVQVVEKLKGWTDTAAAQALEINEQEGDWLFSPSRTIEDFLAVSAIGRLPQRSPWFADDEFVAARDQIYKDDPRAIAYNKAKAAHALETQAS